MSDLLALAERCEAATGSDRDIDTELSKLFELFEPKLWSPDPEDLPAFFILRHYTASLDSAMALVPEGFGGQLTFFKDGTAKAFLWQPYPTAVEVKAATPALALVAVALRVRAATPNSGPSQ